MFEKEQKNTCCNGDNCGEHQKTKLKTELNLIQINFGTKPTTSYQDDCYSVESKNKGEWSDLSELIGQKFEFRVYGMDCPFCALTIEKSIGQLENIKNVSVNYSMGKMQVVTENPSVLEKLPAVIKKLGYTLEPIEPKGNVRIYTIEGMDCSSCALTLENHLKQHPSVKSVRVNFSTGKMHIEHDNSTEEIIKEVEKLGYKASLSSNRLSKTKISTAKSSNLLLLVLSGVLLLFGFLGSLTNFSPFIIDVLYAISILIGGYKPAKSAYYAIKSWSIDMNVLMTAAVIGAVIIGDWIEGATVVWLFALGNALQTKSLEKTRNSIRSLLELAPNEALVKEGQNLVKKPVEEVAIGDIIVVKPGERIPLDGEIVKGESTVNQASITGEPMPVDKTIGDTVYAGTINENGYLEIKVTKLVKDTIISKIIHSVEEAQEKKAHTQAFIDKFAQIYTPIVFALALAVMIFPPLLGFGIWKDWFYKGLELLVIACPCALVISTPVAIVSAIGNAAKNGALIKGGVFLETAGSINVIAFDKTGTLTEGKPKVSKVIPINTTETELLSIARTLEEYSTHPIALAVVNYAKEKEIPSKNGELFKSIVGKGVQARIDGIEYFAGNLKLFQELNIPMSNYEPQIKTLQNEGNTLVIVGTKEQILGIIAVSDVIRETTVKAIQELKNVGVDQIVMLTGDNKGTAEKVASQTGVNRYFAELLPEDKVKAIKQLQDEGKRVAMVGDGINDAPALATANLGIAMGGAGTDTAMEIADIVLMADNLDKLPYIIKLSKKTLKIIKQNIWFSLTVKFAALLLIFPGWLTLWIAILSDTGAALLVILNSMRLLRLR